MDARDFGMFLAQTRKARGLTQAELAEQLHVTDKAVSRWERGIGLPDINTLEPLADALGLSLADLMHCRDPQEIDAVPETSIEDFLTMLRRQRSFDWHSVRAALLILSILLAVWGIFAHPGTIAVHWYGRSNGDLRANGWMASYCVFPILVGFELMSLEIWNFFDRAGYFWKGGEKRAVLTWSMSRMYPAARLAHFLLEFFFFFVCGFLVPCCEVVLIFMN